MRRLKKALLAFGTLAALFTATAAHGEESFERALALASQKRYAEARDVLDPLLARAPGHSRARPLDGILHARAGHLSDAIEVFEALQRDHPDMSEPYNNLAVIYALQGRLDDARTTLLAVLERQPDAVVYANLGDVYTKLADRAYQRAREPGGVARPKPALDTVFALPRHRPSPWAPSRGNLPRSHAAMRRRRATPVRRCRWPRRPLPPSVRTPQGSRTAALSPRRRCGFSPTVPRFWRCATRNGGLQTATGSFCRL